jgi:hypothetical protein
LPLNLNVSVKTGEIVGLLEFQFFSKLLLNIWTTHFISAQVENCRVNLIKSQSDKSFKLGVILINESVAG